MTQRSTILISLAHQIGSVTVNTNGRERLTLRDGRNFCFSSYRLQYRSSPVSLRRLLTRARKSWGPYVSGTNSCIPRATAATITTIQLVHL